MMFLRNIAGAGSTSGGDLVRIDNPPQLICDSDVECPTSVRVQPGGQALFLLGDSKTKSFAGLGSTPTLGNTKAPIRGVLESHEIVHGNLTDFWMREKTTPIFRSFEQKS